MSEKTVELSAEELAERRAVTVTRSQVVRWAHTTDWTAIKIEYHRRVARGETLLLAWRRAMWVVYHRTHA